MRTQAAHHAIRPRHRNRPAVIPTAACCVLLAACGSSSSAGASASGPAGDNPNTAQAQREIVEFVGCMRNDGVAGLATPTLADLKAMLAPSTPHSRAFQAALPDCAHLLPFGGPHDTPAQARSHKAAFMAFARCIRSHGFPSFPDPSTNGQITHEMVAAAGINLNQPAVRQAGDACVGVTHGFITTAIVARFVAGR